MQKEIKSFRLNMVISPSEIEAIDNWRKKLDDLPSRSEAIRRLINEALDNKSEEQLLRESLDLAEEEGGSFTADEVFPPLRKKFEKMLEKA